MLFRLLSDWIGNRPGASPALPQSTESLDSSVAAVHLNEGAKLQAAGLYLEAERAVQKALAAAPNNPQSLYILGSLLGRRGDFQNATTCLRSALDIDPGLHEARIILANIYLSQKQFDLAAEMLETVSAQESPNAALLNNYGLALYGLKQFSRARTVLQQSLSANPRSLEAYTNLGLVCQAEGKDDDAENHFRLALDIDPAHPEAVKHLCRLLMRLQRSADALEIAQRALAADPTLTDAHRMAGFARFEAGDFNDAAADLRHVLSATEDEETLTYLARTLQSLGQYAEAMTFYDRALSLNPQFIPASWYRSLLRLQTGYYSQGWRDYEYRLLSEDPPPRQFSLPRWDGEPSLDAHLLVYAEQGLGDQLMFCSCIPDVLTRVKHCTIECSTKLEPLLRRSFPACGVIGTDYAAPANWLERVPNPNATIPMGSLPAIFRQQAEDFPAHGGYLVADPEKVERWRNELSKLGPGPKIGISWIGGSAKSRRDHRSMPLSQWEPILTLPGIQFINLQYTPCQPELAQLEKSLGVRVHHWQTAIDDYDETAALVCALDLVISVQTAIIHLCGALGRPAWVLVPVCAEWRYGCTGETMDWYPSLRLFRQQQLGDWDAVLRTVRGELATHFGKPANRST